MQRMAIKSINLSVLKPDWFRADRLFYPWQWIYAACPRVVRDGLGVVVWGIVGAGLGAAAAGFYGVLFGALEGLVRGDLGRIVGISGYFAVCGAIAGALVAGMARMIELRVGVERRTHLGGDVEIDGVFLRPTALANPLIARWRFVERLASEDGRDSTAATTGASRRLM